MSNYQELKQQAAELLRQAEELRSTERSEVLQQVRELIADWDFTAADLGLKGASVQKRIKPSIKYQHPNGGTWTGRGMMPNWLRSELANGATKEQFLVQ